MFLSVSLIIHSYPHSIIRLIQKMQTSYIFFLKHSIFVAILSGCSINFHIAVLSQQILNFSGSTYFTSVLAAPEIAPGGPARPSVAAAAAMAASCTAVSPTVLSGRPPAPLHGHWTAGSWPDPERRWNWLGHRLHRRLWLSLLRRWRSRSRNNWLQPSPLVGRFADRAAVDQICHQLSGRRPGSIGGQMHPVAGCWTRPSIWAGDGPCAQAKNSTKNHVLLSLEPVQPPPPFPTSPHT